MDKSCSVFLSRVLFIARSGDLWGRPFLLQQIDDDGNYDDCDDHDDNPRSLRSV